MFIKARNVNWKNTAKNTGGCNLSKFMYTTIGGLIYLVMIFILYSLYNTLNEK